MPSVMGVNGLITDAQLGLTLPHEHLFTNLSCYWTGETKDKTRNDHFNQKLNLSLRNEAIENPWAFKDNVILDDINNAINETLSFLKAGGKTIVDVSPSAEMGRNPLGLKTVSTRTGANIIMSTGRYSEPSMLKQDKKKTVADLVKDFTNEFINGIGEAGIHPGLLKVAFVDAINKESEIRSLRAAAQVQHEVGCALSIHPHIWEPDSHLILDILEKEGCDLRKVILCHQDYLGRLPEYLNSLVKRGVFIEFDTFGSGLINDRMWRLDENQKVFSVKRQIEIGNVHHLLLSGDMCLKIMLAKWGGKGLMNIPGYTLPAMQAAGISKDCIQMMVIENPQKVLCH